MQSHETNIRLKGDTDLAVVEEYRNGFLVSEKKVMVDHLLESLFRMLEDYQYLRILKNYNVDFGEFLENILVESDEDVQEIVLDTLISYLKDIDEQQLVGAFDTLAGRLDLAALHEQQVNSMLQALLERLQTIEDKSVIDSLFTSLLKRLDLSTVQADVLATMLQLFVEKAQSETDREQIHLMYQVLGKKADRDWVRQEVSRLHPALKVKQSPLLPKNCIMYHEYLDGTELVLLDIEKGRHNIILHDKEMNGVSHPRLLMAFFVRNNHVQTVRIAALKEGQILSEDSVMYRYPFSNVHGNFFACWPEVSRIPIKSISRLETFPNLFFRSPANGHLFNGKNLRQVFTELQKDEFQDELLQPTGFKLQQFIERR